MRVFGLQERFRESTALIGKMLEWPDRYAERNKSSMTNREFLEKEDISDATLARIRSKNEIDMELYRFGINLFETRLRKNKTKHFFTKLTESMFKR